jgi:hypothetical protein
MKTMAAYTAKIKAEVEGKTQKVQNSPRAVTTGIYRGVPGCPKQNYSRINFYVRQGCCLVCISL